MVTTEVCRTLYMLRSFDFHFMARGMVHEGREGGGQGSKAKADLPHAFKGKKEALFGGVICEL